MISPFYAEPDYCIGVAGYSLPAERNITLALRKNLLFFYNPDMWITHISCDLYSSAWYAQSYIESPDLPIVSFGERSKVLRTYTEGSDYNLNWQDTWFSLTSEQGLWLPDTRFITRHLRRDGKASDVMCKGFLRIHITQVPQWKW